MNEMYSVTEREAFFYGFRLGVRLMAYLKAGRRLDSYSHSKNALVAFFCVEILSVERFIPRYYALTIAFCRII